MHLFSRTVDGSTTTSANSNGKYEYAITFNANEFVESAGQLKATFRLLDNSVKMAAIAVELVTGVNMCWDLNNDNIGEDFDYDTFHTLTMGQNNNLQIVKCAGATETVEEVTFFRVISLAGEVIEQRLGTADTTSPYRYV